MSCSGSFEGKIKLGTELYGKIVSYKELQEEIGSPVDLSALFCNLTKKEFVLNYSSINYSPGENFEIKEDETDKTIINISANGQIWSGVEPLLLFLAKKGCSGKVTELWETDNLSMYILKNNSVAKRSLELRNLCELNFLDGEFDLNSHLEAEKIISLEEIKNNLRWL